MSLLPVKFRFSELSVIDEQPTFVSESRGLKRLTRRVPSHRFKFSIKTTPLNTAMRKELRAFLSKHGSFSSFNINLGAESNTAGTATGLANVAQTAPLGDTTVILSLSGELAPGDLITFANHDKVYQVVSFSGSQVEVWPPLVSGVTTNTGVNYKDVLINVYNEDPEVVTELSSNGGVTQIELNLVENI